MGGKISPTFYYYCFQTQEKALTFDDYVFVESIIGPKSINTSAITTKIWLVFSFKTHIPYITFWIDSRTYKNYGFFSDKQSHWFFTRHSRDILLSNNTNTHRKGYTLAFFIHTHIQIKNFPFFWIFTKIFLFSTQHKKQLFVESNL